ncbi:MAG: hypothetical protein KKG75_05350 [Nanoarchaeota archaeon]|nr:hypothetical protein [Nanoarchaeota archaeon]
MVLAPFKKEKAQKKFGLTTLIVGLILIMITAPFYIKFGGYSFVSTSLGGALALIGLVYFIDAIS